MSIKPTKLAPLLVATIVAALISSCAPSTPLFESTVSPATATPNESLLPPATPSPNPYPIDTVAPPTADTPVVPSDKLTAAAMLSQTPPVTAAATETPVLGIIEGLAPPYSTDVFRSGGTQWNGYINNVITFVFAGARGQDSQQGVVIVENPTLGGWFDTPAKDGALRITSANGPVLSLTAADGAVYQFDASSGTYVSPTANPNITPTGGATTIAPTAQATTAP